MTIADHWHDTGTSPSRIRTRRSALARRAARAAATRRRREEQEIHEAIRAEAEETTRKRPALLSLLSHDLRNPLSVMMIGLHSLGRALPADHPGRKHLDMIRRNATEMLLMLDNTSEAARIDRGDVSMALGLHEVADLVAEAVEAVRRPAQDRPVTLTVKIAEGLPPVLCTREKLVRVLTDLVGRAVRLSPKNGTVSIDARPDADGGVRIAISDGGAEIPEQYAESIFELPRDENERRALGQLFVLDLFVARGVIEAHDGRIWMERGPDHRNTFVITLPSGDER
jgi:signal transduction histidine kinase